MKKKKKKSDTYKVKGMEEQSYKRFGKYEHGHGQGDAHGRRNIQG